MSPARRSGAGSVGACRQASRCQRIPVQTTTRRPFSLRETEATTPSSCPGDGYDSYAHSFAGMGVQFALLLAVDSGITLLLLRRTGLWQRLRAAPLSRLQLLGSRVASGALIGLGCSWW